MLNSKTLIIGHRGCKGDVLENTLESIIQAIEWGADGVEFDVRRCQTGQIVLFHDETLERLGYKDNFYFDKVRGKTIDKLQWYHLYNTEMIDSMGKKYKISQLVDVLRHPIVYNSGIIINIELKDTCQEEVCNIITELIDEGLYDPTRFIISSYDIEAINYVNEFKNDMYEQDDRYKNLGYGLIFHDLMSLNLKEIVGNYIILNKDIITHELLNKLKNIKIFVYTVNSISEYPIPKLDNYVDGIITDRPRQFL